MITSVVDCYKGDGEWDLDVAKKGGIRGLIYKATEGMTYKDSTFGHAMRCAAMVGMLRGAYHFARGEGSGTGREQAREFLSVVTPYGSDILLCLDLEGDLESPRTMKTDQAAEFLQEIRAKTGRWPVLYGGLSKTRERMKLASPELRQVFGNCPLWLAKYGEAPTTPQPWSKWSLWQYSDGKPEFGPRDKVNFPRSAPGFHRCDLNAFDGTTEELEHFWETAGLP